MPTDDLLGSSLDFTVLVPDTTVVVLTSRHE